MNIIWGEIYTKDKFLVVELLFKLLCTFWIFTEIAMMPSMEVTPIYTASKNICFFISCQHIVTSENMFIIFIFNIFYCVKYIFTYLKTICNYFHSNLNFVSHAFYLLVLGFFHADYRSSFYFSVISSLFLWTMKHLVSVFHLSFDFVSFS